jgi:hypothetical protein
LADDSDFAYANIGQVKFVFAFDIRPDSDNDLLPDWWEVFEGTNPNVSDANADYDGDGVGNLAEFRQGTYPVRNPGDTDQDGLSDAAETSPANQYPSDPTDFYDPLYHSVGLRLFGVPNPVVSPGALTQIKVGATYDGDSFRPLPNAPVLYQILTPQGTLSRFADGSGPIVRGPTIVRSDANAEAALYFRSPSTPGTVSAISLGASSRVGFKTYGSFVVMSATAGVPPNNDWTNSQPIYGRVGTVYGTAHEATREPNEPDHGDPGQPSTLGSVWYKWVPPVTGDYQFTFTNNFAAGGFIYTGSSVDALNEIGVVSYTTFQAAAGNTYYIGVEGEPLVNAAFGLSWKMNFGPANDFFEHAEPLPSNAGTMVRSNVGATSQLREPDFPQSSIWFKWVAPSSGFMAMDTHGTPLDTVIYVYSGNAGTPISGLPSSGVFNDDENPYVSTSSVGFSVDAGKTYWFSLDTRGVGGGQGNITINWQFYP